MAIKKFPAAFLVILACLFFQAGAAEAAPDGSVKDAYEKPQQKQAEETGEPASDVTEETKSVGVTFGDIIRMIAATVFVLALLIILLKYAGRKNKSLQKANSVENLGGTSLGGSRSVQLIKVGGRILVVGVGENIQLLKEIDDEAEYSRLIESYNQRSEDFARPAGWLADFLKKRKNLSGGAAFTNALQSQIEEMKNARKKAAESLDRKGSSKDE